MKNIVEVVTINWLMLTTLRSRICNPWASPSPCDHPAGPNGGVECLTYAQHIVRRDGLPVSLSVVRAPTVRITVAATTNQGREIGKDACKVFVCHYC